MIQDMNRTAPGLPCRWEAKWIDPELPSAVSPGEALQQANASKPAAGAKRSAASYLRRSFVLNPDAALELRRGKKASLYITCHGIYKAFLNGQRIGCFELAPGTGDYRKRLTVQCYEVSGLLREGENQLMVILGDGWYRGSVGIDGLRNYYGTDLALLCQLEIGGRMLVGSDEYWEASQSGPIRENDLQQGERYDARLEPVTGWHAVTVRNFGYDSLAPTQSVPILEQERFPGRIFTAPNGDTLVDFGQNLAGYTYFCITAGKGQTITLWHGETLDENGNFTQSNFDPGDRNKNGGIPRKSSISARTA